MSRRIFRAICLVALAVLLASLTLIFGFLYSYFSLVQMEQLQTETVLAAQGVTNEGYAYFDDLEVTDCRITWIDSDGTVLYDSKFQGAELENHLHREEVREALETGVGESSRYSASLMEESVYTARRLEDGTVLRLSNQRHTVLTLLLATAQPICIVLAVALVLAMVMAFRVAKWIVSPLNELDLDAPLSNDDYRELSPVLRRIHSQQQQLRAQADELKRKQRQFDAVVGSMNEGLVLMDNKSVILSMNPAAARILGLGSRRLGVTFPSVYGTAAVSEVLYRALNGEKTEKVVDFPGGPHQIIANPIRVSGVVSGVAVLMLDVTEKQKAESLRREFAANVSHELKTPLHAISGYAELMKSGLVRPEDQMAFSGKIYAEAQRLMGLVEDILRLSRLDEGGTDMQRAQCDLGILAEEILQDLTPVAELAGVKLELSGGGTLVGIPHLLRGILFNLVDNAIKYNRPGGTVEVAVAEEGREVILTVRDTGIGIAKAHQDRIFERFYRVDKSHSRQAGGTGLGLSIVKHAAKIHNAAIAVASTEGEGTAITVRFPKD